MTRNYFKTLIWISNEMKKTEFIIINDNGTLHFYSIRKFIPKSLMIKSVREKYIEITYNDSTRKTSLKIKVIVLYLERKYNKGG